MDVLRRDDGRRAVDYLMSVERALIGVDPQLSQRPTRENLLFNRDFGRPSPPLFFFSLDQKVTKLPRPSLDSHGVALPDLN
jgi:hypothetical protein